MNAEQKRLADNGTSWKKWGPYLSERQWGTVREDYSEGGDAWNYFPHEHARSRAYRWGEDGLAGISDDLQRLCFSLALWNGKDPILKERLFGLTNGQGNHGEDVKEYYFYLDSTPTHSYMKYLYKYPQSEFPYEDLIETNRLRGRNDFEYELLDTGVFNENRYFDVFVEYAKAAPEDLLIRISVHNRGPDAAELHLLPTLWFRNRWSWDETPKDSLLQREPGSPGIVVRADEPKLGTRYLSCDGEPTLLFTENETNTQRLFNTPNATPYVKDGINDYVVHGQAGAVNPEQKGTKVAAQYVLNLAPGECRVVQLRLSDVAPSGESSVKGGSTTAHSGTAFDDLMQLRKDEADEFYTALIPSSVSDDARQVIRQGLSGMLWSKQLYPLRRASVAQRTRLEPIPTQSQVSSAQRGLAPHVQRRRDLDAGQMGVSLVRRLGLGLPCRAAVVGRHGLRQTAAEADAARTLHAPQWSDSSLRMEFWRRQSSRARLGHHFCLPHGTDSRGKRRYRVAQDLF